MPYISVVILNINWGLILYSELQIDDVHGKLAYSRAYALYQNADIYLLDDPFSAVDAHTAKDLFNVITYFLHILLVHVRNTS